MADFLRINPFQTPDGVNGWVPGTYYQSNLQGDPEGGGSRDVICLKGSGGGD